MPPQNIVSIISLGEGTILSLEKGRKTPNIQVYELKIILQEHLCVNYNRWDRREAIEHYKFCPPLN